MNFKYYFSLSNIGTLVFFVINFWLIYEVLNKVLAIQTLVLLYVVSVLISFSFIGEKLICILANAKDIKRKDDIIKIIPLLELILDKAKTNPTIPDIRSVKLKIINDKKPNAYALGKNTIAITKGLLSLPDEIVTAILAHEVGHLAYGHSRIQLLIGGGNFLIVFFLIIMKSLCLLLAGAMSIISFCSRSRLMMVITTIFSLSIFGLTWLWVKTCKIFLMWSQRKNEYIADEYAVRLDYGYNLALALDCYMGDTPNDPFFRALLNDHPSNDERIAAIQCMGVKYSRYSRV